MRFAIAAAGLVAAVSATPQYGYGYGASNTTSVAPSYSAPPSYTTEVVTAYTTYCPEATQLTYNGQTYTVTSATTLTITNCPCTVTKPVYSSVVTSSSCPPSATPSSPASSPVAPPYYPPSNGTAPAAPPATGSYTPPSQTGTTPPSYTGAASKASFGVVGLIAAGLVAAL